MGFPTGARFKGIKEQKATLERQYIGNAKFIEDLGAATTASSAPSTRTRTETQTPRPDINQERYNLLGKQLRTYGKYQIHRSIWLYIQGHRPARHDLQPARIAKWNRTIQPFLDKTRRGGSGSTLHPEVEAVLKPPVRWIDKVSPTVDGEGQAWSAHVQRAVFQTFLSASFEDEFAGPFEGMDEKELDALAHSFHFDERLQSEGEWDLEKLC